MSLRIDEIFAFVATDDDGNEGVAAQLIDGSWFPLLGADMERVNSCREIAQGIADASGKPLTLVLFGSRSDVETIEPENGYA